MLIDLSSIFSPSISVFFPHLSTSSFTVQNTSKTVFNEISEVFGRDALAAWVTLLQMLTQKSRD